MGVFIGAIRKNEMTTPTCSTMSNKIGTSRQSGAMYYIHAAKNEVYNKQAP